MFNVVMGTNDMKELYKKLTTRKDLKGKEKHLQSRFIKTLDQLKTNPRYPSLNSHRIADLTDELGYIVWQSDMENNTSGALRMFWRYGPEDGEISVVGVSSHPENGKRGRMRVDCFSGMRQAMPKSARRRK